MTASPTPISPPLAALRRFVRRNPDVERCELCGATLSTEHEHLLEPPTRRLLCSCEACAILFHGQASAKYRRVPRDVEFLPNFRVTDGQWESLHLPINLAFFFFSSPAGRVVALFPSPAGATESLLTLESWKELVADNPSLAQLQPDVEALLVDRIDGRRRYVRLPIDQCFKLVGMIRTHWHGLSGGPAVWEQIDLFFADLEGKSTTTGAAHARPELRH